MKKFVKAFCIKGLMWGAWSGPIILAIVWLCLKNAGVMTMLTVDEAVMNVFSAAVMGFIAAGISAVYSIESMPKALAGAVQGLGLYLDYLGFYILNGWLLPDNIWIFTIIFAAGFAAIWLTVYITVRVKVDKMNKMLTR